MKKLEIKIEAISKKYDLPTFPNICNNVMTIIASAEPSDEDKNNIKLEGQAILIS